MKVTSQTTSQLAQIHSGRFRMSLKRMVGPCGLEPQTSTVSRERSNQLSYGPNDAGTISQATAILPHSELGAQFGSRLPEFRMLDGWQTLCFRFCVCSLLGFFDASDDGQRVRQPPYTSTWT